MKKPLLSIVVHLLHLALFLLAMLLLQPCVVLAIMSTPSSLAASDSLKPPNYVTSPSGDFAFGFRTLPDSNASSSSSFLLEIWFRFDPGRVVWFAADAGSGSAVVAGGQSVLSLSTTGQLSLANPGTSNAWTPYTDASQNYGSLLKDGNIVMYRTDLPGSGPLAPINAYWSSRTCCVDNGTTLYFDAELVGHLYYRLTDGTSRNLTAPQPVPSAGSRFFYQHATLDPDGILRVYILPNNTGDRNDNATWSVVNTPVPSDGCQAVTNSRRGMCGPNSYCVYDADNRLDCECLGGYTFLHTQFRYEGCAPAFLQDTCDDGKSSHSSEFKLVELPNTYWANPIFYEQHKSITAEQCQDLCLHNCLCAAALFDGSSNSCLEAAMLTSGWQQNGTSMRTLVKVRIKGPPAVILPYAVIAGLGMLLLATACILLVHCYITNKKERNRKYLSATGDKEALQDLERVERFARIAIWCVQGEPSMRPTMRSVLWMMEGTMEVDPLPADDPPAPRVHDFPAAAASGGTHENSNSSSTYGYD
ncbi:unnamed protein product [Miscanthus lutarioriparius]|uniref:non-specific serine/threonine protein kinase n=1 Tax=Miscanthus lutarioriparius TaxID=422564 RepID=A0A811P373_9POAL|nr:unnamed protein product [Miscanthus lutarioriparius]